MDTLKAILQILKMLAMIFITPAIFMVFVMIWYYISSLLGF